MSKKKKADTRPTWDYICRACADDLIALCPVYEHKGGAYTIHVGTCDRCHEEKPLGHIFDYNLDHYGEYHEPRSWEWD